MHQDQRIGLALGVLLVGACAAFFFRNETRELPSAPQLKNARELDERIAERPTRPYIKGIEAVEIADRRRNRSYDDQQQSVASSDGKKTSAFSWDLFSFISGKGSVEKVALNPKRSEKSANVESDVHEFAPIAIPNDSQLMGHDENNDDDRGSLTGDSALNSEKSRSNSRSYVVQRGESLSSIAAKLLGDRKRFPEIFEANLDQLDDPNEVKLGMTLRIPGVRSQSAAPAYSQHSRVTPSNNVPEVEEVQANSERPLSAVPPVADINSSRPRTYAPNTVAIPSLPKLPVDARTDSAAGSTKTTVDAAESRKFIPVRRSPLPRQAGPQSHAGDQRSSAGRKLSQISQEPSTSKIAR